MEVSVTTSNIKVIDNAVGFPGKKKVFLNIPASQQFDFKVFVVDCIKFFGTHMCYAEWLAWRIRTYPPRFEIKSWFCSWTAMIAKTFAIPLFYAIPNFFDFFGKIEFFWDSNEPHPRKIFVLHLKTLFSRKQHYEDENFSCRIRAKPLLSCIHLEWISVRFKTRF